MRPVRRERKKDLKSRNPKECRLILGDVVGLSAECVLKDGFHKVISRELEGRFLDFGSIQDEKILTTPLNLRKKITEISFLLLSLH